jgi:hypothetical protein
MPDLIKRARQFATQAHRGIDHRRKYTREPYEVHLKAVADLVAQVSSDPEMIAAAWLHDVVEDTPTTIEEVEREFGPQVAALVADLTDVSRPGDGHRAARKEIDRRHTAAASPRAKTIKIADILHNVRSICRFDPQFARVFLAEARRLMAVLEEGDPKLYARLWRELDKCESSLAKAESKPAPPPPRPPQPPKPFAEAQHRALEVFSRAFRARDIAEPLRSFDHNHPASAAGDSLHAAGVTIAGVRRHGLVTGYLKLSDLGPGPCSQYQHNFDPAQVIDEEASLADAIYVLSRRQWCFVESLGQVSAVIGVADIQKPVVRVWLFGFITVFEMAMAELIRLRWPGDAWTSEISEGRLSKARELQALRAEAGQHCELLDCLQLGEKANLLIQVPEELARFGFTTTSAAKRVIRDLVSLRNNLAHGQDIVRYDWPQIIRMARRFEDLTAEFRLPAASEAPE